MESVVRSEPWDVRHRLGQLGLLPEHLLEVLQACQAARGGCTENDPPAAPGWVTWQTGTRRLRELLRPLGWEKDETDNLSTVVNHETRVRVAVANTDDATGVAHLSPTNSSREGTLSEKAVDDNFQQPLPLPEFLEAFRAQVRAAEVTSYRTYYFCVYISGDEARDELSYPVGFSNGYFCGWQERIIVVTGADGPRGLNVGMPDDEFAPESEIMVRRRA